MSGFQSFLKLKSLQKAMILRFLERSAVYDVTDFKWASRQYCVSNISWKNTPLTSAQETIQPYQESLSSAS